VSAIGHVHGDMAGHIETRSETPKKSRVCQWKSYSRTDRHTNMTKPRLSTLIHTAYSETNYSIRYSVKDKLLLTLLMKHVAGRVRWDDYNLKLHKV